MTDLSQLSARELEQLSAYIDGELTPREAEQVRVRLDTEPDLRQALKELQATSAVLRDLPQAQRPRSFALTEAATPRSYPLLQFSTAVAALAFVVVIGADLLVRSAPQAPEQAMVASEGVGALADADRSLDLEAQPEIPAAELEDALPFAAPAEEQAVEAEIEGAAQSATPLAAASELEGAMEPEATPAAEIGESAQDEAEAMDEYFKAAGRDAQPPEAAGDADAADLAQEEEQLSVPSPALEPSDSGVDLLAARRPDQSLLLPVLRLSEIILGFAVAVLVSLTLWIRRR